MLLKLLSVRSDHVAVVCDEAGERLVAACRGVKVEVRFIEEHLRMLLRISGTRDRRVEAWVCFLLG